MRPDVVTFWHGPLDRLRQTCLRSQVAAGHNVTVYSFDPLAGLPDGVGNAEAEAILPHAFSEKLRPPQPDGSWRDWTTLQFSDFFRMRLMAQRAGLWLDADVLLLRPVEIDPAKPFFAWERPRQLGNSVLYLPADDPIVVAFEALMRQDELTPDWLALRHRMVFSLAQAARQIEPARRYSRRDLWAGGADRAGRARRRTRLRLAEEIVLRRSRRTGAVLRPLRFCIPDRRSRHHGAAHFTERPWQPAAGARQPLCMGGRAVWPALGRLRRRRRA